MTHKNELDGFYIGETVYTGPNSPHKVTIKKFGNDIDVDPSPLDIILFYSRIFCMFTKVDNIYKK